MSDFQIGQILFWSHRVFGCEFIENQEDAPTGFAVNSLFVAENPTVYLVNSTIGNNVCLISDEGYAIGLTARAKLNIYNSIIYLFI